MSGYLAIKKTDNLPRIPLEGSLDLTYRCNNNCRHCWLRIPAGARERENELAFDEICQIVDEARQIGCRRWSISGGEPMLRPDFPEIFDYITKRSASYSINTNGTLITPAIAELMTRKGRKMIALYGASEAVHDRITRNPGSFAATMRGFELLQEAGAGFSVQIIPMKDNYHEYPAMIKLAESLSPSWRVGAPWLFLSANGSPVKNAEITAQRLPPGEVIDLDPPDMAGTGLTMPAGPCREDSPEDCLFADCIRERRNFHIDPYGTISFCSFIKDPCLRYNLRTGSFPEAWDEFIPSIPGRIKGGREYQENCGSCANRDSCRWCPVYAYLETGRYSAKIPYLCEIAAEEKKFRDAWNRKHRRYFTIAGITICLESDLDLGTVRFDDALTPFAAAGPGDDNVVFRHYFEKADIATGDLGNVVYRKPPWLVSQKDDMWIYEMITPGSEHPEPERLWVFGADYTRATIYHGPNDKKAVLRNGFDSLACLSTDQIWLAPLLADRDGLMLHSSAVMVNGQGLVFAGHSGAGKSTMVTLLKEAAEKTATPNTDRYAKKPFTTKVLCDDRNILKRQDDGWQVYGTWNHGDIPEVSATPAPLRAIMFLHRDTTNGLTRLTDRREILKHLLATLVRPMVTATWWQKELDLVEILMDEIPCYTLQFTRDGAIIGELEHLVRDEHGTEGT